MVNIIDAIIVLFLVMGAIYGFKKGGIQMLAYFIGTFLIIYLSFIIKTPLARFLYMHLPFFKAPGIFKGISAYNIFIYEGIAFLIILTILIILLKLILKFTGILSKIVDKSIILTLPSKLLGILLGVVEVYIILFALLYMFSNFGLAHIVLDTSKLSPVMLNKTPLTSEVKNNYKATREVIKIANENISDKDKNDKAIKSLLKYGIIDEKTSEKLKEKGDYND